MLTYFYYKESWYKSRYIVENILYLGKKQNETLSVLSKLSFRSANETSIYKAEFNTDIKRKRKEAEQYSGLF